MEQRDGIGKDLDLRKRAVSKSGRGQGAECTEKREDVLVDSHDYF
jgi:hypothetical protein